MADRDREQPARGHGPTTMETGTPNPEATASRARGGWFTQKAVRRRRADVVVLVCSLVVLAISVLVLGRLDQVPAAERAVFQAINGLPSDINPFVRPPMFLGTLAAVPLLMLVCAAFRKFRMGFVMGVSGLSAYLLAIVGKQGIGRGRPATILEDVHLRDVHASGLGFPSGHAAVSAALIVAALPYLPRRWRAPVVVFPVFMAFARVYVGAHLPLDVVSGAAIGIAVASAWHLFLGVPMSPAADPPINAPAVDRQPRRSPA